MALVDPPLRGGPQQGLPARSCEPPEGFGRPAHRQFAALAGGQVDDRGLADPQQLVGALVRGFFCIAPVPGLPRRLLGAAADLSVALGVGDDGGEEAHPVQARLHGFLFGLLPGPAVFTAGFPAFRHQPVEAGHRQQLHGQGGRLPGAAGCGRFLEDARRVAPGGGGAGVAGGKGVRLQVAAHRHETSHREPGEGAALPQGAGEGGPVEVLEHRTDARIGGHAPPLLAGVLKGEEQRLGGRAARLCQGLEQGHLLCFLCTPLPLPAPAPAAVEGVGAGRRRIGRPAGGDRAALVEVGRDQVDRFVEGGSQGGFFGRNGGPASVGGLEKAGVDDHLVRRGPAGDAQYHPQLLAARQGARHPGHGAGHPLVAGHHRLDGPFLGRQYLGEDGPVLSCHNPPS